MFTLLDFRYVKSGLREYVTHWPQRFPILMMAAFFFALKKAKSQNIYRLALVLISMCLFFTFTRAIYLSILVGITYLLVFSILKLRARVKKKTVYRFCFMLSMLSALLYILYSFQFQATELVLNIIIEAFNSLFGFFDGTITAQRLGGSDSIRMYHWKTTIDIWSVRPVFGTGFLSIYQFSTMGSVHNQYLDVLLQTGLVGIFFYLYLWFVALRFTVDRPEYFSGLIAIFTYGLFHETTKLSYVGLLLMLVCSRAFEEKKLRKSVK